MGYRVRVYITKAVSGNYTVVSKCKFVATSGASVAIPAMGFSGSTNIYNASTTFANCYQGTNVWHNNAVTTTPSNPLWGAAHYSDITDIAELVMAPQGTGLENRAPADFTVDWSLDDGVTWVNLAVFAGVSGWAGSSEKRFAIPLPGFVSVSGNLTVSGNGAGDYVALLDATTKKLVKLVEPATNGDWTVKVLEGDYYVIYFGDGCQPIAHGPYTVSA